MQREISNSRRLTPSIVFSAPAFLSLALCLWAVGCGGSSSSRLPRQPAPVDSPPPLAPMAADTGPFSPPSPATRPATPAALASGPPSGGPPIAPRDWRPDKPLAASRSATAPARATLFATGHLAGGGALSGWHFVFAPGTGPEGLKETQVLPNNLLEQMAGVVSASPGGPVLFHITAEVTRYKEEQYLMIRGAQYESPNPARPEDRP